MEGNVEGAKHTGDIISLARIQLTFAKGPVGGDVVAKAVCVWEVAAAAVIS